MEKLALVILVGIVAGLMLPDGQPRDPKPLAAAAVASSPAEEPEPLEEPIETTLRREDNGHFYVHAQVNGELVQFLVDTGATGVALTEADARRVGVDFSPGEFTVVGRGASGEVRGKAITLASVSVDGKEVRDVSAAVLEGSDRSLLGQSYLSRISGVEMSGDTMILR